MNGIVDHKQARAAEALRGQVAEVLQPGIAAQVLEKLLDPADPVDARLIAAIGSWREGDTA